MKKVIRVIIATIFIILAYAAFSKVNAATASLSANKTSVNVGEKVTISVNINAAAWEIHVTGAASGNYSDVTDDGNNTKKTQTLSFTPSSVGDYTVSLSGNVTDGNSNATTNVGEKITIKAVKKEETSTNKTDTAEKNKTDTNDNKEKEPVFKSTNEKVYAIGDINVRKSYSADSNKIGSLSNGDSVVRTGVGDNGWSKVTFDGQTGYIKSSLLTTEEQKKSDEKSLKSLYIDGYELSPEFDPEITEYSVIVDEDVEQVDVKAEATNEKCKVDIKNVEKIVEGENLIKIIVTAEDETVRTYIINVSKQNKTEVALSSLKIQGYTIDPAFSPNIYEYKLSILDPNVTKLDVIANSGLENAKIEVTGNESINQGTNTILIKVESEDGTSVTTYKIIVNKMTAVATTDQNNTILYGGIAIIVILIIAIIVVLIIAKKKSMQEELDDDDDEYEDLYGYQHSKDTSENKDYDLNPYASEDLYEDSNNRQSESVIGKFDVTSKDIEQQEQDLTEKIDEIEKQNNEWGYTDSYKPRRSKGKHSK